jgi:hypothetical protein
LSPEDETYYENYLGLFIHPGWKQFVGEAQELLNAYSIEEIKKRTRIIFCQRTTKFTIEHHSF